MDRGASLPRPPPPNPRLPIIVEDQGLFPADWPLADDFYLFLPHPLEPVAAPPGSRSPSPPAATPVSRSPGPPATPSNLSALPAELQGLPGNRPSRDNVRLDPRSRKFTTFYDLGMLVDLPDTYPTQNIGVLRTKWRQAFQQTGNGAWDYVEYVPPWTDPDWDARFVYIKGASSNDEVTAQYAMPGLLQTQRPALLPGDAQYNPTDAAKRWGFYPWQVKGQGNDIPDGHSGTSPILAEFPTVQLTRQPRAVTAQDLQRERQNFEENADEQARDRGFRQAVLERLQQVVDAPENAAQIEYIRAILFLQDMSGPRERRDDYQRSLFHGFTSNEVRNFESRSFDSDKCSAPHASHSYDPVNWLIPPAPAC